MQPGLAAAGLGPLWAPEAPAVALAVAHSRTADRARQRTGNRNSSNNQDKGTKGPWSPQAVYPKAVCPCGGGFRNGRPKANTTPVGGGPGGTWGDVVTPKWRPVPTVVRPHGPALCPHRLDSSGRPTAGEAPEV